MLVVKSNFILMILLVNQWFLESKKPPVTLFMPEKNEREIFNKEKFAKIILGQKKVKPRHAGKFQQ